MTTREFRVGDKAVVESPVFHIGPEAYEHFGTGSPKVGDVITVVDTATAYRPHEVATDTGYRIAAEGLIHLDDVDRVARERAPETVLGTATVRVTVRVFIGDTDITSLIDTHALEALASAKDKEAQA